ncbi:hypothetical protein E2C01_097564 [Portunus trituberculatus]|uniref:Uncharacterized protein n=1 Tax=Portunus trituberculatus TaxID=210409 RepID=A0A5B7K4R8_PORTR|nr:hypothetical protein [Portunus trituberculatus]
MKNSKLKYGDSTPASESLSGEGTRNVPMSESSLHDDPKSLDEASPSTFSTLTSATFAISTLGDCNVHHQFWLTSPSTDHPGELAINFPILHVLVRLKYEGRSGGRPNDTTTCSTTALQRCYFSRLDMGEVNLPDR